MEGTELYEKLMTGSSEMSIRIKGLIEIRLKKPKKDFVVPDNIEDFDIRTMYNEKRNGNENVKLHPCGEEAQGTSGPQRTHPSP